MTRSRKTEEETTTYREVKIDKVVIRVAKKGEQERAALYLFSKGKKYTLETFDRVNESYEPLTISEVLDEKTNH